MSFIPNSFIYLSIHPSIIYLYYNTGMPDDQFEDQEIQIDQADQELMMTETNFQKDMKEINKELDLLRQHKTMLQDQLQNIEEHRPSEF